MFILDGKYEGVIGSDLERDGMFLEISKAPYNASELILEIFYSDLNNKLSVTLFSESVDLELMEEAIKIAKHRLVPSDQKETEI